MNKIIISTESGSDLPWKISVPNLIEILPMHISFGNKTYLDGELSSADTERFFKEKNMLPVTSAPNPDEYSSHFKRTFQKYPGCKIIHIAYSSKLSVSYQNAVIASKEFPPSRLQIIDSLSGSIGIGALIVRACDIITKLGGLFPFDKCVSIIKNQTSNLCCSFVLDTLDYLKAGGRISAAAHFTASALSIKPSISIENGVLEQSKRYRGSIYRLANTFFTDFVNKNNPCRDYLIIGYGFKTNKALLFSLKRQAHKMRFKKSWCFQLGSAVTAHTGSECIGFAAIKQ